MPRVLLPCLLVLASALLLVGCTEAEERWTFDSEGGGVWSLDVRWNASLWRRTTDLVGRDAARKLLAPAFPLHPGPWQDAVARGFGLKLLEAGFVERDPDGREDLAPEVPAGWRHFRVRIAFQPRSSIARLGPIAGRALAIEPEQDEDGQATGRFRLRATPFPAVPVLDVAAQLMHGPLAKRPTQGRDQGPLARLGLRSLDTGLLRQMVALHLERAKLRFVVETPRTVTVGARGTADDTVAAFTWTFADLAKAETSRAIEVLWTPSALDRAPAITSTQDKRWKAFTTTRAR